MDFCAMATKKSPRKSEEENAYGEEVFENMEDKDM